jgi:hypothetical protein
MVTSFFCGVVINLFLIFVSLVPFWMYVLLVFLYVRRSWHSWAGVNVEVWLILWFPVFSLLCSMSLITSLNSTPQKPLCFDFSKHVYFPYPFVCNLVSSFHFMFFLENLLCKIIFRKVISLSSVLLFIQPWPLQLRIMIG